MKNSGGSSDGGLNHGGEPQIESSKTMDDIRSETNSDAIGLTSPATGHCFDFAGFDNSLFEETEKTIKVIPKSYNAKVCSSEWFNDNIEENLDDLEKMKIIKYKADFAYMKKDFSTAVEAYESCLEMITDVLYNSSGMKKEILDAKARCYIALNEHDKALEIATNLYEESGDTMEQKTATLTLMFDIFQSCNDTNKECVTIQRLLVLNSYNPTLWYKLAGIYKHKLDNAGLSQNQTNMRSASNHIKTENFSATVQAYDKQLQGDIVHRISLCLTRAEIICNMLNRTATSFFKSKMEDLLKNIKEMKIAVKIDDSMPINIRKLVNEHLTTGSDCDSVGTKEFEIIALDDASLQNYFDSLWFEGFK
ncbi:unnamed protein product [Owenia fusiformis]|nr:unnamed protein product [Owenia fusiformis]